MAILAAIANVVENKKGNKMPHWIRFNKGWGRYPIWLLDSDPKATLKRDLLYLTRFVCSVCVGDGRKKDYVFSAKNLKEAKKTGFKFWREFCDEEISQH
jgi:hypothetical protein